MANLKLNYTALSNFLNQHHSDVSLFRFRELSIRNLLHYQAELAYLQRDLEQIEKQDAAQHADPEERANYRWKPTVSNSVPEKINQTQITNTTVTAASGSVTGGSFGDLYVKKMLEIRDTLVKYNEALEAYSKQNQLPSPSRNLIKATREWLDSTGFGDSFLSGTTEDIWDPQKPMDDFLTFAPSQGLSYDLAWIWIALRQMLPSSGTGQDRLFSIDASESGGVAQGVAVMISSLLPVLPIVVLFFIHNLLIRIIVILAFTALFAGILVFGLKLSAEKVLTITTAIAAVQVVYVGSTANYLSSMI